MCSKLVLPKMKKELMFIETHLSGNYTKALVNMGVANNLISMKEVERNGVTYVLSWLMENLSHFSNFS